MQAADWWSLGVVMVETLTGSTPFTDQESDMQTYRNIVAGEQCCLTLQEGAKLLPAARDLSGKLLTVRVAYRIGYLKGGAADVVDHGWFSEFDWDGLLNTTLAPPWKPKFKDAEDTTFFEPEDNACTIEGPEEDEEDEDDDGPSEDAEQRWFEVKEVYDQATPHSPNSSPPFFRPTISRKTFVQ